jgi:hypothetical protein
MQQSSIPVSCSFRTSDEPPTLDGPDAHLNSHMADPRCPQVELILSLAALSKGLYDVVAMSLIGSVLSNLLLVLGELLLVMCAPNAAFDCRGLALRGQLEMGAVTACRTAAMQHSLPPRLTLHGCYGTGDVVVAMQAAASLWAAPSTTPSASMRASTRYDGASCAGDEGLLRLRLAS